MPLLGLEEQSQLETSIFSAFLVNLDYSVASVDLFLRTLLTLLKLALKIICEI